MARLFDSVQMRRPRRNKFDLSHERKLSFNMGNLVPMLCHEIVPGDSFRVRSEVMLRFAALLAPIMHRVNVTTHYFFVPNRLIWEEWEDFITGGRLGTSTPVAPFIKASNMTGPGWLDQGTLADYLGLPVVDAVTEDVNFSALPFRAYTLIFDEYYRDQNLVANLDISKASGEVTGGEITKLCNLRIRAWEKDYFTSALPFAQRGPAVDIPMEVGYRENGAILRNGSIGSGHLDPLPDLDTFSTNVAGTFSGADSPASGNPIVVDNIETLNASINDLRRSVRLQEWLEKNARGGARYVEQILSHFGVKSSDARLQRPEYLGGGRTPVVISEVLQTMQNETGNPLGTMGGHGVSVGTSNGFKRTFEEHGFVMGIMSVLPKTAYQQGIERMWSRFDKFDYYWPEFAQIGEQEVLNKELFYDGTTPANPYGDAFGYQSRYAEYKYGCSTVHGEFRDALSFWHMGRIFDSQPALNETFVESDPTYRIFPVTDNTDKLLCQIYNRVDALRPMPYFGTPTL